MYVYSNIGARSRNHFRRGKSKKYYIFWVCTCSLSWRVRVTIFAEEKVKSITYSGCVPAALVIQPAMRMHPVIFSSVACLAVPHFLTLDHKRHDFGERIY